MFWIKRTESVAVFFLLMAQVFTNTAFAQDVTILDKEHYSNVFGELRNYRIFLPPGYETNTEKNYPVIYFYHGWSQRYFGSSDQYADFDKGEENQGDNIANFVSQNEVIVVKADGYNRSPDEDYYVRPYNVSPVETYRQFPMYFPELVNHIDDSYRTIADRSHRAISGLSMGGFMTFWISGKYPHLVSAAGNFCGSPEFMVGPKDFPVEFRHLDMYDNYGGINVRLNYGDKDFIRGYHQDMNKIWTQVMDNYEYHIYDARHSTAGLGEMFTFLLKSFENPVPKPSQWDHIDAYPSFSVWDYQIKSNRNEPGFTILENVDKRGFRSSVRTFLPDGELIQNVELSIKTPPIYKKNQLFQINDVNPSTGQSSVRYLKSDNLGRLKIDIDGGIHEIGINKEEDTPNIATASFEIKNMDWATHDKEVEVLVKLLNKGSVAAENVTATLEATRKSAVVLNDVARFGSIGVNKTRSSNIPFIFKVKNDVEIERFKLLIKDGNGNQWSDDLDIKIMINGPEIDFVIADGKEFSVSAAGDDTISIFLGHGNGDGKANPGESIVILANDKGRYYRTFLHTTDQYVNPAGIHIRKSDHWAPYDHVGASAKYSVPVLASNIPNNHRTKFFAEYWLPDYPNHIIKRGVANITITGTDKTAPEIENVKMTGNNTIQAKVYDGGDILSVKAEFSLVENPEKSFEIELNNEGKAGDLIAGDLIFSRKIEEQGFGLYKVVITAEDYNGNKSTHEWQEVLEVH